MEKKKEKKKRIRKIRTTENICELELLSIDRVAKLLRIGKLEVQHAMTLFVQSGGRDGLAYIERGARRCIRAGAIKDWLVAQERKVSAA